MFKTLEKLEARFLELEPYRHRQLIPIDAFQIMADHTREIGARPPAQFEGIPFHPGDHWDPGVDAYAWLRVTVDVPGEWAGQQVVGFFQFSQYGGWTERGLEMGIEGLLFLEGKVYQGIDANHREVLFPEDVAGQSLELNFRVWSGMWERSYTFQRAYIALLDQAADDMFYWSMAVLDVIKELDESHLERHRLLHVLDQAYQQVDWSKPNSERFYASLATAVEGLHAVLPQEDLKRQPSVTLIGQTHIDMEWLWRLHHTREKVARSFATALRLMEHFPEYLFLQTQPVLLAALRDDYPDLFQQVVERIQEGRWEPEGAMWLEPDANMPSGESLVRHLLYGKAFIKEAFGIESRVVWLLDTFGYTAALPQIMKKAGVDYFSCGKMSWMQYNTFPYDLFWWKGIDGTSILTHLTVDPRFDSVDRYLKVNAGLLAQVWKRYTAKEANLNPIAVYGFGDGGGGPNRESLEMARRLPRLPAVPRVKLSKVIDYFDELAAHLRDADPFVPTWDGELYLEMHRGTYTSQARIKRLNRKAELLYRDAEILSTLAYLSKKAAYPAYRLEDGWKLVLLKQFHDVLPGSSIPEVYEDSEDHYAEAFRIGEAVHREALNALIDSTTTEQYTVCNMATWEYSGLVYIDGGPDAGRWVDINEQSLNCAKTATGWLVEMANVPALGATTICHKADAQATTSDASFAIHDKGIETPFYIINWNDQGQLTRLFDKDAEREVLAPDSLANQLQVFEDKPLNWDAWDVDLFYQQKTETVSDLRQIEVIENNSLRMVVRFTWQYQDSLLTQNMIVYASRRRIDFETEVDWHERQQLLKVAFPVNIRAKEATYDIAFGNLKRPTHWNTSWDYARFEVCAHQWADLSERGYGVSLLNDCKYGYDIHNNVMRLSLIKSAINPDGKTVNDQGKHIFTYALLPHQGDWVEGKTVQEAWFLNNPLPVWQGRGDLSSFFVVRGGYVVIDTIKLAEDGDGVILRLHEYGGARGPIALSSDYPVGSWQPCDLLERPEADPIASAELTITLAPYEIKTYRVRFAIVEAP
ncbi:MAG: alpha-mannosidase [Chloroflexi bacterium]|nr:alpha-mannosidase [Chloroflexota bacterium]